MRRASFILLAVLTAITVAVEFEVTNYNSGDITINRIAWPDWYADYRWAVGDSGQVFKLNQDGTLSERSTLDTAYNLTGIAFGNHGYIVGYKRATNEAGPKWKGSIWRTTNSGSTWNSLQINPNPFPPNITVPYLNVAVGNVGTYDKVWISCGFGYVLWSSDGGTTWRLTPQKPGGENHYGWLWGIWSDHMDPDSVWVCTDQSKLVAVTNDGGSSWTTFEPFDTLSSNDISSTSNIEDIVIAGSRGRLVSYYDEDWLQYYPFRTGNYSLTKDQWFYGVYAFNSEKFGAGSGGTIGSFDWENYEKKYWYSRRYDLRDIEAIAYPGVSKDFYAVGSNAAIIHGLETESSTPVEEPDTVSPGNPPWYFHVVDYSDDHGWQVTGNWDAVTGADCYEIYIRPKCDMNLNGITGYGTYQWIKTVYPPATSFSYDSALTGRHLKYKIRAYDNGVPIKSQYDTCTSIDNVEPPKVTGLQGVYNRTLDAAVIWWDPITAGQEPNLGGYWVCPEIFGLDYNINHPCPLYRNYYAEKVPEWARGHYWGFWVCGMDRSGNWGDWSDSVLIPIPNLPTSSPYATALNQGRHIARWNKNAVLHVTYEDEDKVFYTYSTDNGESWTSEELGTGNFPSITLDHKDNPWIAYWKDGDIVCKVKRENDSWKTMTVYDGNGTTTWAGAPAIAMGTLPELESIPPNPPLPTDFAYITYAIYEGEEMPDMPSSPPYTSTYSCIKLSVLDTIDMAHYSLDEGDGESPVGDPAIAVTPADYIHIVWQKEDEIWYSTNLDVITYSNWKNIQMHESMNISESPEEPSLHPFAESYGDKLYVAWKEGDPGEIYRRMRDLSSEQEMKWDDPVNISNSANDESDYPVLATSDVVVYQEEVDENNFDILAWINGDVVNLSETESQSKYPNIIVEPPPLNSANIFIDAVWTEELVSDTLYDAKFTRYEYGDEQDDFCEYISVSVGDTAASPYCKQRDGRIDYGEFACDYDNSSLIYTIPYLNPTSNYLLRAIVYKEGNQQGKEEVYVDSTSVAEVTYEPYVPETVYVLLPKETYENDFEIGKEIEKILGNYALLADLKIYEVSLPDSGGGGGQSAGSSRITRTVLYQNNPNPFNALTKISFGLAKEGYVSLSIFDATGRKVRTLVNQNLKPDNYNFTWDGKDNRNKNLARGVYFYRLQAEDFKDTKKTILLK